jgi:glycosyltransferase involved in cell wall biosynthesis
MGRVLKEKITLSVITPVTRLAGRTHRLRSWLYEVSEKQIEVFLVHDWNDAETSIELNELVKELNNPRVYLIEGIFGGPGAARNEGISNASGEWVCFWDSDDMPQISETLKILDTKVESSVDCLVANYVSIDDTSGARKFHILGKNYLNQIAINPGIWRFFFRKSSFPLLEFCNLKMAEDQLFLADYLTTDIIVETRDAITYHYIQGGKFSLTKNQSALNDLCKASKQCLEIMRIKQFVNLEFTGIIFFRQVFSSIKYGNFECKIRAIYYLIQGFLWSSNVIKKNIILGIKHIILRKLARDQ